MAILYFHLDILGVLKGQALSAYGLTNVVQTSMTFEQRWVNVFTTLRVHWSVAADCCRS